MPSCEALARGYQKCTLLTLSELKYLVVCVQGIIQHATINNLAFGRNVEETLRILQAIQYVQENPDEVPICSALSLGITHNISCDDVWSRCFPQRVTMEQP